MNPRLKAALRRALPRSLAMRRIWSGPLRGRRIYTSWHDYPGALLGTTERDLLDWFRLHAAPGETWLDVGGHYGYTSLALSNLVGPTGRVFCFEPVTASAECIARTMTAEHATNVRTIPLGLSASPEIEVRQLPSTRGMADATLQHASSHETIRLTSFDSLWPTIHAGDSRVHGVKIDVQGLELEVLNGMRKTLAENRPKFVVELHAGVDRGQILALLSSFGYGAPATLEGAPASALEDDTSYAFLP